jgi:hypothetical protein
MRVETQGRYAYFLYSQPDEGPDMSSFDEREKGFEAKFKHDADTEFRIIARRNKLAGLWAAEKLGLSGVEADAYAKTVVEADFEEPGDADVVRKLVGDLVKAGSAITEADIREQLSRLLVEARAQITAG